MEKGNSQLEHDSQCSKQEVCFACATHCQSQHLCHFWRINLMFEAESLAAVNQIRVVDEAMIGCKNLKIH